MLQQTARVLVVDDDRFDNDRYCHLLRSAGYDLIGVTDPEQALRLIEQQIFDVVLLDMLLPLRQHGRIDFGGLELLRRIRLRSGSTQVIAVTGYGSRELAADAMREGAFDYITKDLDTEDRLPGSVRVAMMRAQALRANAARSTDENGAQTLSVPNNLIADSAVMRQTLRRAQRLAGIDSSLLITGEPGVGKELIASVIHLNSRYVHGPFVIAMCRSLSASLAELWGEASKPRSGYCAQAEGGTLLLKGIQDLPFSQQKQIVPFLRERRYRALGASIDTICDLRVIATSNTDLERLVRQGRFWRALFDELSVATLDVPPLRERRDKDDLLALAGYLLHRYGLADSISPAAAALLVAYDYPQGNINELENILRGAALQSGGGVIQPEHLPAQLHPVDVLREHPGQAPHPTGNEGQVELSVRFVPGEPAMLLWESEAGGSTRSTLTLPFRGGDLDLVHRALDAAQWRGQFLVRPTFEAAEIQRLMDLELWAGNEPITDIDQRVGRHLYQAMIADAEAKSALDTARRLAEQHRRQLHLILRFPPDAIHLAGLPWELMWDERQPLLLSRGRLASCIRYLDVPHALPPALALNQQLRLLVVSPQESVSDEHYAEERSLRIDALKPLIDEGRLIVEELRPAYLSMLTERLIEGPPIDVLHFYGHGMLKNGNPHLLLDGGPLNASQVAALVGELPLVVLFACRAGEPGRSSIFTGIAPMLSAEGAPTVVAMQYSVPIKAANRFLTFLYRSLARGESVQTGVARARQALYVEFPDSWYLPVLYVRSREVRPVILVRR